MKSVEEAVIDLLVNICGTKKVKKNLQIDLIKEGYLDSLGVVSLLTEIEDEFEVEIPLQSFNPDEFNTAEKIIAYIKTNTK